MRNKFIVSALWIISAITVFQPESSDAKENSGSSLKERSSPSKDGADFYFSNLLMMPGWNLVALEGELAQGQEEVVLKELTPGAMWTWKMGRFVQETKLEPARGYWCYNPGNNEMNIPLLYKVFDPSNQPPIAVEDTTKSSPGQQVLIEALLNDGDPNQGDQIKIIYVEPPQNGSAVLLESQQIAYTPSVNFNGKDSFTYFVSDDKGRVVTSTVTVEVTGNTVPVVVDDEITINENAFVVLDVLKNDFDGDGDPLSLVSFSEPSNGTLMELGDGRNFRYTPKTNWGGTDKFTYTLRDMDGNIYSGQVIITVQSPGVAMDDTVTTTVGSTLFIDVLKNDTDSNQDMLEILDLSTASHGTVEMQKNNTLKYIPAPDRNGIDTFTYTVTDGYAGKSEATVTVIVNSIPIAEADIFNSTQMNQSIDIPVLENDLDPDIDQFGDSLKIKEITKSEFGKVQIVDNNSKIRYTPNPDFLGRDAFAYTVVDMNGGSSTADVEIYVNEVPNTTPVANGDTYSFFPKESYELDVLVNDIDVDDHNLEILFVRGAQATIDVSPEDTLIYRPKEGQAWVGSDRFSYAVSDGHGGMDTGVVTIDVADLTTLAIDDISWTYSAPYLLDFNFSLRDSTENGHSVIIDPNEIELTAYEKSQGGDQEKTNVSPSETAVHFLRGDNKQLRCFLIFDYTNSMADTMFNGDRNGDGKSDAITDMERAAKSLIIDRLLPNAQIGLLEFHREDVDPEVVSDFTSNGTILKEKIDNIWLDYVRGFPASSRCWDAVNKAIDKFSAANSSDQERFIIFLSDGRDESSTARPSEIIKKAADKNIKISCIGIGEELREDILMDIANGTKGEFYNAADAVTIFSAFREISNDLQGQYIVRWATLRRSNLKEFIPSFKLSWRGVAVDEYIADPDDGIGFDAGYRPQFYVGDVLGGKLRLVADPIENEKAKLVLRSVYMARHIRRIRLAIDTLYPFEFQIVPTEEGGICPNWSIVSIEADPIFSIRKWIEIESPNPQQLNTAIAYGAPGPILQFDFTEIDILDKDRIITNVIFDNKIYGGSPSDQSLIFLR